MRAGDFTPTGDPWNAGPYYTDNEEILRMAADNYDMDKGGVKLDARKVRLDLIPPEANIAEAAVYTYGAIKYDDWNWAKGMRKGRIVAALLRHAMAYLAGENRDQESGLPHTWHMRCCTGMLIGVELRGVAEEDRQFAVEAYRDAVRIFENDMLDPRGTAKNAGGSLTEPVQGYDLDEG